MASLWYHYAPMNGSKSAQLLMAWHNYEEHNNLVMTVKPKLDTRDSTFIKSRALDYGREADRIVDKDDFVSRMIVNFGVENGRSSVDVILIDEAQFLTKAQVDDLGDIVDDWGITVIAYGLLVDFQGFLFEGSKRLIEIADKTVEYKTICPCCKKKALINMRVDEYGSPVFGGDQIQIGLNYLPVCRKEYKRLKRLHERGNKLDERD
ncbi:thymidine kinase [Pseudobutyrivibrio sp.]